MKGSRNPTLENFVSIGNACENFGANSLVFLVDVFRHPLNRCRPRRCSVVPCCEKFSETELRSQRAREEVNKMKHVKFVHCERKKSSSTAYRAFFFLVEKVFVSLFTNFIVDLITN